MLYIPPLKQLPLKSTPKYLLGAFYNLIFVIIQQTFPKLNFFFNTY